MHHPNQETFLSAMLVAKNGDTARAGGFIDRSGPELILWPHLYMHIRTGQMDGAVWADKDYENFLVVVIDKETHQHRKWKQMPQAALHEYVQKDGVFYRRCG